MRNEAKSMRLRSLLAILAACAWGCFPDYYPTRVDRTNKSVISFLIKYARAQSRIFESNRRFDSGLFPDGTSNEWFGLAPDYERVLSNHYDCRFDFGGSTFHVTCAPRPGSTLRVSFYVDQSRAIRLSATEAAGPMSPRLRLTLKEEAELYGEPRAPK
jgi:hypothetical protein